MFFNTTERGTIMLKGLPTQAHAGQRPMGKKVPLVARNNKDRRQVGKALPTPKRKEVEPTKKRLYVLDTNVFMHDPSCLFRFEEHDIFITSMVFEELDNHKRGHDEINRNVREVSRTIELITSPKSAKLEEGASLIAFSGGIASGRLFMQMEDIPEVSKTDKPDNQILAMVSYLVEKNKNTCEVVLVTKDTNMRIKGRAAGILVEDYHNDMVIEDTDLLNPGISELPSDFWTTHNFESSKVGPDTYYKVTGPLVKRLFVNEFVHNKEGKLFSAKVFEKKGNVATLKTTKDYTHEKNNVCGIVARNAEQSFALNLLLDPDIHLVTLVGKAGSGKTLLTLAAAIAQAIDKKLYSGIIITRVTVSVGEDIGFLPGTEEEKMGAWMGALDDNLEVLEEISQTGAHADKKHDHHVSLGNTLGNTRNKRHEKTHPDIAEMDRRERKELLRDGIKIKSLNFMRGRTFNRKFVIIDETQNLTLKQMRTLVTRAGPGTKIVCMGNLEQIDTPYLTEGDSGLTHLVTSFQGWEHGGHVILLKGERSLLATEANKRLK